jgi:two-component system sensor histidine kinase ChiS
VLINRALRVTVLDDHRQTLEVMRDILEPAGYAVSCTTRIAPELHEIRDTLPDLVVIDLLLATDQRELSGWDVARLVRSHADLYRVPILVVSADHRLLQSVSAEAHAMRDVHLLAKPFTVDELLAAAGRALGSAGIRRTIDGARPETTIGSDAGSSSASAYD